LGPGRPGATWLAPSSYVAGRPGPQAGPWSAGRFCLAPPRTQGVWRFRLPCRGPGGSASRRVGRDPAGILPGTAVAGPIGQDPAAGPDRRGTRSAAPAFGAGPRSRV